MVWNNSIARIEIAHGSSAAIGTAITLRTLLLHFAGREVIILLLIEKRAIVFPLPFKRLIPVKLRKKVIPKRMLEGDPCRQYVSRARLCIAVIILTPDDKSFERLFVNWARRLRRG